MHRIIVCSFEYFDIFGKFITVPRYMSCNFQSLAEAANDLPAELS